MWDVRDLFPVRMNRKEREGGKGALIQKNKSATISTLNDQYLFQPVCSAGFKANQGAKAGGIGWQEERACTLNADRPGLEPSVCVKCYDARGNGDGDTVNTITGDHNNRITDYTTIVCQGIPCYSLQGNTIDRDAKQNGGGVSENVAHTLNSVDRHGVVYCMAHGQANAEIMEDVSPCLNCNHEQPIVFDKEVYNSGEHATGGQYISQGGPAPTMRGTGHPPGVCYGVDCRSLTEHAELYPTLQAKSNGGQSMNYSGAVRIHYIVRRLTPVECARLQGFADGWGHPDPKEDFTDEEYRFWLDVRNTHAAINGKTVKDYTKGQMLTWYNKLHTASAECRMWGNGIALPPALYCMQGIVDALGKESEC